MRTGEWTLHISVHTSGKFVTFQPNGNFQTNMTNELLIYLRREHFRSPIKGTSVFVQEQMQRILFAETFSLFVIRKHIK